MKAWSGTAWAEKPVKVWNGTAWTTKPTKVWDGSAWVVKPPVVSGPTSRLLLTYTPGSDRNDFTGEVGVRLGIGAAPFTVSWVGARRHSTAQTGVHNVKLYEWFSQAVQRTAAVDYTGVAVGAYAWKAITPITLPAGSYYALLMEVFAYDGQTWCNPGAVTYTGMANVYDSYYAGGLQTGGQNTAFIGLDLGW